MGIGPSGTGNLTALAWLHLHIVDDGPNRHIGHGHRVTGLHIDLLTGDDLVTGLEALRGQDIAQLTVVIFDQGDERRAVRIVFQPFHSRRNIMLQALEIHDAIAALCPAATTALGDATSIVASAMLVQAFGQGLNRVPFVKV